MVDREVRERTEVSEDEHAPNIHRTRAGKERLLVCRLEPLRRRRHRAPAHHHADATGGQLPVGGRRALADAMRYVPDIRDDDDLVVAHHFQGWELGPHGAGQRAAGRPQHRFARRAVDRDRAQHHHLTVLREPVRLGRLCQQAGPQRPAREQVAQDVLARPLAHGRTDVHVLQVHLRGVADGDLEVPEQGVHGGELGGA